MITINSSHVSSQNAKYQHENLNNYTELLDRLNLLDPKKWPVSENGEVENIQFGNNKICHVYLQFILNSGNDIVRDFQTYKMEGEKEGVPNDFKLFFKP